MTQDILAIKDKLKEVVEEINFVIIKDSNDEFYIKWNDGSDDYDANVSLDAGIYTYLEFGVELASKLDKSGLTATVIYSAVGGSHYSISVSSPNTFVEFNSMTHPTDLDFDETTGLETNSMLINAKESYISYVGDYPQDVKKIGSNTRAVLVFSGNATADIHATGKQLNGTVNPVLKLYNNNADYDDNDYFISYVLTKVFEDLSLGGTCRIVYSYDITKGDYSDIFDYHNPNYQGHKSLVDINLTIDYLSTR